MYIQEATSWKKHKAEQRVQRNKQTERKKKTTNQTKTNKDIITKEGTKKQRERITRGESPSPRPREPLKEASNWSSDLSMSSKLHQFHSLQIHHIRHNGAKFQI